MVSEPLRKLTRKPEVFAWGKNQADAFNELKYRLVNAKTLGVFDPGARTRVIADASAVGIECVFTQHRENDWKVICYTSRSLTDCEKRYSQTEK